MRLRSFRLFGHEQTGIGAEFRLTFRATEIIESSRMFNLVHGLPRDIHTAHRIFHCRRFVVRVFVRIFRIFQMCRVRLIIHELSVSYELLPILVTGAVLPSAGKNLGVR